jgi:hypothetical protein
MVRFTHLLPGRKTSGIFAATDLGLRMRQQMKADDVSA